MKTKKNRLTSEHKHSELDSHQHKKSIVLIILLISIGLILFN